MSTTKINIKNIRYFNLIKIVDNGNAILKSYIGDDVYYKNKFFDEIVWMLKLQKYSKKHLPEIFDYSLDRDNLWIKCEFLQLKSIHDQYISEDKIDWDKVVDAYRDFIKKLSGYKPKFFIQDEWRDKIINFYLERTVANIKKIERKNELKNFFIYDYVYLNEKKYPSLKTIVDYLVNKIIQLRENRKNINSHDIFERLCTPKKDRIFFTHLDLTFGNIFFNEREKTIKVIDPRGSFSDSKEYGDIYYDFAKIYQCIYGMYDFIVEDKFNISFSDSNSLYFEIEEPKNINLIRKSFNNLFKNVDIDIVKLIESLQFFAMLPAHMDSKNHQMAQIIIGITHFYDVIGDEIWK